MLTNHSNFLKKILLFCFSICYVFGAYAQSDSLYLRQGWSLQSSFLVKEKGEKISSPGFSTKNWYGTEVPNTVLRTLIDAGEYPEPYTGMNNMKIPDASQPFNDKYNLNQFSHLPDGANPWTKPYWYRKRFVVPEHFKDKQVNINFDGINYSADVWINGHKVADSAQMRGMFHQFSFNITDYLNETGNNYLAVKIHQLPVVGLPAPPQLKLFGPFYRNCGDDGGTGKNVTQLCSVGWDWVPAARDRNIGIWQDVYLTTHQQVDIEYPQIKTDLPLPDTNSAEVSINTNLKNQTNKKVKGKLKVHISPRNFSGETISFTKNNISLPANGKSKVHLIPDEFEALKMNDPHLWWPTTYGKANLYNLELNFIANGGGTDHYKTHFGIREVTSQADSVKGSLRRDFKVNGYSIQIEGGAWVPEFLLDRDRDRYRKELKMIKNSNANIVRLWGGGITPPKHFFTMCDEMGLLVWHDIWHSGGRAPVADAEKEAWLNNTSNTIKRLRNHPSIFLWTNGNERPLGIMYYWDTQQKQLYMDTRDSILKYDKTRPFIPSSHANPDQSWGWSHPDGKGSGVYSHGPYAFTEPEWYFEQVNTGDNGFMWKDESGLPAVPTINSLRKFIPHLGAEYPVWTDGKNKQALSFDGWDDYVNFQPGNELNINGQAVTVSAWIKRQAAEGHADQILHYTNNSVNTLDLAITGFDDSTRQAGKLKLDFESESNGSIDQHSLVSGSVVPKDQWVHVAAVIDGSNNTRLFINGKLSNEETFEFESLNTAYNALLLGGALRADTVSDFFNGAMDEVAIYNRALSDKEIVNLYTGNSPSKGLSAYLPFNEGEGIITRDAATGTEGHLTSYEGRTPLLNNTWGYHDACAGNGKYNIYHDNMIARYGEVSSVADYAMKAQMLSANGFRALFESANSEIANTGGMILWKTAPAWPSVVWQLYDWYLNPTAAYYYSKTAREQLHIQLNLDEYKVSLVNAGIKTENNLQAEATLYNINGEVIDKHTQKGIDIADNDNRELFNLDIPQNEVSFAMLKLFRNGRRISENFYWLAPDDDYTPLLKMDPVEPEISETSINQKDGKYHVKVVLENPSGKMSFFNQVNILKGLQGEEVLPSDWSDNYVNIPPGESRALTATFEKAALEGATPHLMLEGWNTPAKEVKLQSGFKTASPVEILSLNIPENGQQGENFKVHTTVANIQAQGQRITTEPIYLYIDGEIVHSKRVGLKPKEEKTVTFNLTISQKGSHKIRVGKLQTEDINIR